MKIFIGMETSGTGRREWAKLGHDVISCDILPPDDDLSYGRHVVGDVFETLDWLRDQYGWEPDLGIFHPTCTFHTISAAWAFNDPDFVRYPGVGYHQRVKPGTLTGAARREARELAELDVKRIWALKIKYKALENPVGTLSSRWRKPTQIIQPYQFGEDASKATCLWLDELPALVPTEYCKPRMVCNKCNGNSEYGVKYCSHCHHDLLRPRWSNQTNSNQNNLGPSAERWKERSKSYPGILRAMAVQWSDYVTYSGSH